MSLPLRWPYKQIWEFNRDQIQKWSVENKKKKHKKISKSLTSMVNAHQSPSFFFLISTPTKIGQCPPMHITGRGILDFPKWLSDPISLQWFPTYKFQQCHECKWYDGCSHFPPLLFLLRCGLWLHSHFWTNKHLPIGMKYMLSHYGYGWL